MTESAHENSVSTVSCELQNVVPPKSLYDLRIRGSRGPQGLRRPRFSFSSSLVKERHLTMLASGNVMPTDQGRLRAKMFLEAGGCRAPWGQHRDEPHMGSPVSSVNTENNIFYFRSRPHRERCSFQRRRNFTRPRSGKQARQTVEAFGAVSR